MNKFTQKQTVKTKKNLQNKAKNKNIINMKTYIHGLTNLSLRFSILQVFYYLKELNIETWCIGQYQNILMGQSQVNLNEIIWESNNLTYHNISVLNLNDEHIGYIIFLFQKFNPLQIEDKFTHKQSQNIENLNVNKKITTMENKIDNLINNLSDMTIKLNINEINNNYNEPSQTSTQNTQQNKIFPNQISKNNSQNKFFPLQKQYKSKSILNPKNLVCQSPRNFQQKNQDLFPNFNQNNQDFSPKFNKKSINYQQIDQQTQFNKKSINYQQIDQQTQFNKIPQFQNQQKSPYKIDKPKIRSRTPNNYQISQNDFVKQNLRMNNISPNKIYQGVSSPIKQVKNNFSNNHFQQQNQQIQINFIQMNIQK